jgi:methionyl-tRNA formyltransferase
MSKQKIKIIFMGTPEFSLLPLKALMEDEEIEVQTVITQEDAKVGRKQILTPPPVKVLALANGIPVLQPPTLKGNNQIADVLKALHPDFMVVVAFGQILPKEILKIPKYGCINIHGSLLPKYRGASPIEEALVNGDAETGISFIKMEEGLDSGDILLMLRIKIAPEDNDTTLREKLSALGGTQLPYLLKDIKDGILTPIPQNHSQATFCRKIKKEDGLIDLKKMSAREIINKIRAYTPWPSCFLMINNKKLKILKADFDESGTTKTPAGTATFPTKETVALQTTSGILIPKIVQPEGKNPMPIQDFLRGNANFFK